MRFAAWIAVLAIAMAPRAFGQTSGQTSGQTLPDLGGGETVLSPQLERKVGENIMREIRFRDPSYLDDPEIADYLATLGSRLSGSRQDFEFFAIRDTTVNAFALPGGFVGVHTGLITTAETESELASVLAHEVSHVTQRHIARMLSQQQQMQMPMMVALAAAILLGRSRPDLAIGAAAGAQAAGVQASLSYSRDFEREADRIGLQRLDDAGFDAHAMASFFEKMQRSTRVSEDSTLPGYFRTHPVTKRKLLYVTPNYTMRIDGLTERENEVLLPLLYEVVKDPAYQCRFRWEPGSVAFWDNRAAQHYAVPDYPGRRVMNRIVISGDRPF